ncbi:FtsX-like permease family protein [Flavobacteriaceae sp. LMIT009]
MKFPLYIAKRYLFSKSSNNAINFITIIAGIGVVIASAALFVVLSGFAGLKDFSLQFTTLVDPDLKILPAKGKTFLLTESQTAELKILDGVSSFTKVLEERALLTYKSKNLIVTLKGVGENYPQASADSIILVGDWMVKGTDQLVAGAGIANNLSFGVFDYDEVIKVSVPKPGKGQFSSVQSIYNSINAVNSGIFSVNEDLDHSLVYANIETVQYLLNYEEDQLSAVEVLLNDEADIASVSEQLKTIFGDSVIIKTRAQLNDALYKMLNTENLAVYLIFTLVLIIALFNVIGSIIMMILDKKKNLNTLYNLGITIPEIRKIFFLQGSLMSILGGVIGVILGFVLVLNQLHGPDILKIMITPTLPYPIVVKFWNVVIVLITISALGVVASKIASVRISKQLITNY